MSVGLQLYSEGKKYNVSCCNKIHLCIHIETVNFIDGTYELVPTHEDDTASAQVNSLELIQDPNQSSEDPKASNAQEGKPHSFCKSNNSVY